jgi:hypothetical protein
LGLWLGLWLCRNQHQRGSDHEAHHDLGAADYTGILD